MDCYVILELALTLHQYNLINSRQHALVSLPVLYKFLPIVLDLPFVGFHFPVFSLCIFPLPRPLSSLSPGRWCHVCQLPLVHEHLSSSPHSIYFDTLFLTMSLSHFPLPLLAICAQILLTNRLFRYFCSLFPSLPLLLTTGCCTGKLFLFLCSSFLPLSFLCHVCMDGQMLYLLRLFQLSSFVGRWVSWFI